MEAISVAVYRGPIVEARHRVHAVAVRDGSVVASAGEPSLVCYFRSSAKPIQALSVVRARLDLTEAEVAIASASHRAEPAQLAAVRSLLAKAPATEDDLECGEQEGRPPGRIHHNCSGKHAGFLALCRARGWETEGYRLAEHPLQQELLAEVAAAAELQPREIPVAVDGCGVTTFALALERMAGSFARLPELDGAERVLAAMRAHPELVGGEGSPDTALMRALPGWVAKGGAEGLFCAVSPDGLALALKSDDGNFRPLRPALSRFLATLGVDVGDDFGHMDVTNSRGEVVGEVMVT
jgi:L-asparaginase II